MARRPASSATASSRARPLPERTNRVSIPASFLRVRYNGAAHPLAPGVGLARGANCQRFVFELLRDFGYEIGAMRSSELWADRLHTRAVSRKRPLDILLFNRDRRAWGAHLALYLGNDRAIHLCKTVGRPAIWKLTEFNECEAYGVLVGIKRPLVRRATSQG